MPTAKIVQVVKQSRANGTTFGAPTEAEVEFAELVSRTLPSIQKLRLVSSGTEADDERDSAGARIYPSEKIIKFDGCYHGHSDGLLVKAGSAVATLSFRIVPAFPRAFARETLTANTTI